MSTDNSMNREAPLGMARARMAARCSLAAEVVGLSGEVRLRVTGTSMLPSVWPGDIMTISHADVPQVRPGEIALFARESRLLAHRVLRKLRSGDEPLLITRGDSLSEADPPVSRQELLGRVTSILRGRRPITPCLHLTFYERIVSFILRHSDRSVSMLLRLREFRRGFHHGDTEGTEVHGGTEEGALWVR